MKIYAVIDTNILVSGLLSPHEDTATARILKKVLSGEVTVLFNREIFLEYIDVLHRKKFGFSKEKIIWLLTAIDRFGEEVLSNKNSAPLLEMDFPDPKDRPFFETAVRRQADNAYLVTGNQKHFPKLSFIITAKEFLDILENQTIKSEK